MLFSVTVCHFLRCLRFYCKFVQCVHITAVLASFCSFIVQLSSIGKYEAFWCICVFRIFPAFLVLTKQQQRNDHLSIFIFIPSSSTSTTAVTAAATAVFLRNQSANQCLHSSNTTRIRASQRKETHTWKIIIQKVW